MQKHIQDTRQSLQNLQLLAHQTREAEKNLLQSATQLLTKVEEQIARLRPMTGHSRDAAERYQELIVERGKLHNVIGRAQETLGPH